jgi:hypothetical protein
MKIGIEGNQCVSIFHKLINSRKYIQKDGNVFHAEKSILQSEKCIKGHLSHQSANISDPGQVQLVLRCVAPLIH